MLLELSLGTVTLPYATGPSLSRGKVLGPWHVESLQACGGDTGLGNKAISMLAQPLSCLLVLAESVKPQSFSSGAMLLLTSQGAGSLKVHAQGSASARTGQVLGAGKPA